MKKLILFAAAVAAIASCAKVETVNNSPMQEIAFKTYNPSMTKVTEGYSEDANLVMGVSANWSKNGGTYFSNVKFAKSGDTWVGNPTQYWPKQGELTFAVYAPYKQENVNTAFQKGGGAIITFKKEANGKEDFVYGTKLFTASQTRDPKAIVVTLNHSGAKITFNVKSAADYKGLYRIDEIVVKDVLTNGTGTVEYTENGDLKTPCAWTGNTSKGLSSATDKIQPMVVTTENRLYWDAFVLPTVSASRSFEVHYSINTLGGYVECDPETFTVNTANWELGNHYTFNITFNADEITFAPEVQNWNPVTTPDENTTLPFPTPAI